MKVRGYGEASTCRCCGPAPGLEALRPPNVDMAKGNTLRTRRDKELREQAELSISHSVPQKKPSSGRTFRFEVKRESMSEEKKHVSPEKHHIPGDLLTSLKNLKVGHREMTQCEEEL